MSLRNSMRSTLRALTALICLALVALTVAPAWAHHGIHGRVLFRDSFSSSPDPAWTFVNRAGSVTGGKLVIDGPYLGPTITRDGWAMTHVGDRGWRNYTFKASFDTRNVGGSPSDAFQSLLYFRVQSDGSDALGTYYVLYVWAPGQSDPSGAGNDMSKGLVQLFRLNDGAYTTLANVYDSNAVLGVNRARVTVCGARIGVAVNGRTVIRIVDSDPLRFGGVGLGQIWETNGVFDNVVVLRGSGHK